jgi:riboflavin biosynthesis pyrimidine reductase
VADDPDATPTQREISRLDNAIDKVVVSDGLTQEQTAPWHNTRIIRRAEARQQLAQLKRQSGRDILVFGSHTLWTGLLADDLADDLVDELHLMIGPVIVGEGTPVFDGRPAVSPRLTDVRRWDGSENVLVRYEVGRGKEEADNG